MHSARVAFEENRVLFGYDRTEGIVAAELLTPAEVTLYIRDDARVQTRAEPFRPFLWAEEAPADTSLSVRKLAGDLPFRFLVECEDWRQFTQLRNGLRSSGINHFAFNDPVQQFLLASGKTLFKGMKFEQLRRLQVSVELFASEGVANAKREADHLMSIALSDGSGWEELILVDPANPELSERATIERLTEVIRERDPDVIEGHDLFKVTLPALTARAKRAKVKLTWGRDGSAPFSRASRIQIAERTINYPKFQIRGRHLVDTFLLTQFYDISARELETYELADVARHFRIPCELSEVQRQEAYLSEPELFGRCAMEGVRQVRELAGTLSGSYFIQTQIFPYNYQDAIVRGNATKINALLLREYYRQEHSIANLPEVQAFEGGYTDIFYTGVARNVWHVDVTSLYPSVMLRFDCFPAQDRLGIFRGLLRDVRAFRLEAKAALRQRDLQRSDRSQLQALQATFKILINSFYGYLGFAQGHFADFEAASNVTQIGRDLLKKMVAWLQEQGAQVIEIDTDGIYFVPPPGKDVEALQQAIAEILPEGIEVEFDTQFEAMFSYKAKNYALLKPDGELVIRGGALKSRGLEKFQRLFLEKMLRLLLEGRGGDVEALRREFEENIRQQRWPIVYLMRTDTLQDSLANYARKIEASARNRSSAYELALKSGRNYQPGDQISYYVTGTKKNISVYENAKLASEWDPQARDENIEYYCAKLNELVKKFATFTEPAASAKQPQMDLL